MQLFAQRQSSSLVHTGRFFSKPDDWPTGRSAHITAHHGLETTIGHMLAADPACKRITEKQRDLKLACTNQRGTGGIKVSLTIDVGFCCGNATLVPAKASKRRCKLSAARCIYLDYVRSVLVTL